MVAGPARRTVGQRRVPRRRTARLLRDGATGWADAGITVPYALWQRYGDTRVIEEHYASMVRYASWLESTSSGNLRTNAGPYLDWLNLEDPTPAGVVGTAYYAYSIRLLGELAAAIGRDADATRYAALSRAITQAFVTTYVAADGTVQGDSQTGYVLAIGMGLLTDPLRARAADRLVANVQRHGWHLSTGFLGTPDLLPALTATGHLDVAYRLLLNDTYPSWGYEIAKGATTIWERWDSIRPDGSFGDVGMNSFNHYAYGAVGDWMYRTVAGIQPDAANPGTSTSRSPPARGGLTSAKASYRSAYGTIGSDWDLDARGDMRLRLTVPPTPRRRYASRRPDVRRSPRAADRRSRLPGCGSCGWTALSPCTRSGPAPTPSRSSHRQPRTTTSTSALRRPSRRTDSPPPPTRAPAARPG
ncbi:alpha-L-rhamnosidase C-terminal domain-containing protein [Micromonospora sp. M12]